MPFIQIESLQSSKSAPSFFSRLSAMLMVALGFLAVASFVVCVGIFGLAMWVAGLVLRGIMIPIRWVNRLLGGREPEYREPRGSGWSPFGAGDPGRFGGAADRMGPIIRTFVVRGGQASPRGAAFSGESTPPVADDADGPTIDLEQDESGNWK